MSADNISALSLTFLIYLSLAIAYFGWGKATTWLLRPGKEEKDTITSSIWIGWAITLLIFQLIHFFIPLTHLAVTPILILGGALAIPQIVRALRNCTGQVPVRMISIVLVITAVMIPVSVWIALHSMLTPRNYDSGLYYFNTIRWINSYPVVPGLGNLHGRLAFNQAFFVYAGALNFYPIFGHGRSVANSFLFILTISTLIELSLPIIKRPSLLWRSHPFQYITILMTFPVLGHLALSSDGLSSPSPDLTSTLLQLTMFVVLAQGVGEWRNGGLCHDKRAILISVLATAAVTVKLSNLFFAIVVMGFVFLYLFKKRAQYLLLRISILCSLILLIWCLRGVVLSGAPLYPSTLFYVPVEWAVPKAKVAEEAKWVFSWARQPWVNWREVLGGWSWFEPWLERVCKRKVEVVYPLSVSLFLCIGTGCLCLLKRRCRLQYLEWAILLPSLLALICWFFIAPDPRFAHALFYILMNSSSLLFLSSIKNIFDKRMFYTMVSIVFVVANLNFADYSWKNPSLIRSVSLSGWHSVKKAPLAVKTTLSGLKIYTPRSGDQCWDSPLPSTPDFNPYLRLRNPEKIASGFTVRRPERGS